MVSFESQYKILAMGFKILDHEIVKCNGGLLNEARKICFKNMMFW